MAWRVLLLATLLAPAAGPAEAGVNFRTQIWPIFQKSCLECHRAPYTEKGQTKNPKGGLRLDGASYILKGGSNGEGITPGDPDASGLYLRVLLPQSHEDAMPPKGKGNPLTYNEFTLLKTWILEGADFGGWRGNDDGGPLATTKPGASRTPAGAGLAKPSPEALQKLRDAGALAGPVETGSPLLRVEWISSVSQVTDKQVELLLPLAGNIAELELGNTKITDEALKIIGKFTRLTWLSLRGTAVTDAGLAHLKSLTNLTYLNLHSTAVSDAGLASLAGLRKLRNVYLWQTQVTPGTAARFEKSIPDLSVHLQ